MEDCNEKGCQEMGDQYRGSCVGIYAHKATHKKQNSEKQKGIKTPGGRGGPLNWAGRGTKGKINT